MSLRDRLIYAKSFHSIYVGDDIKHVSPDVSSGVSQAFGSLGRYGRGGGFLKGNNVAGNYYDTLVAPETAVDGKQISGITLVNARGFTSGVFCGQQATDGVQKWYHYYSAGNIRFTVQATDFTTYSSASFEDGEWHLMGFSAQLSDVIELYEDGVKKVSDASNTVFGNTGYVPISVGNRWGTYQSTTGLNFGGDIALVAIWENRYLTAGEHAELARNPWQVFKPQQFFVPMDDGGVVVTIEAGGNVTITDVNTTESWADGDTDLVITGSGFV